MNTQRPSNVPEEPDETSFSMVEEEYPVDRLRSRFNDTLGGRPLTVYLVLFAGAAMLLLLLGVVWISATGDDEQEELICTEIAPADARDAVLGGQIRRVNVLVDKDSPTESLTGIQLRFTDGSCRQTPQGADIRNDLFVIIGAVDLYNNYQANTIQVHYQSQEIETELLSTSTATAVPTSTSTDIPATPTAPSATATPPAPTATPTASPTASPSPPASTAAPTSEGAQNAPVGDAGS